MTIRPFVLGFVLLISKKIRLEIMRRGGLIMNEMRAVSESLAAQGYSISYGIAVCEAANGLRELVREADEKMLGSKRAYYAEHDRRRPYYEMLGYIVF